MVTGLSHSAAIQEPSLSPLATFQRVLRSPSNALAATKVVLPRSLSQSLEDEYLAVAVRLVLAAETGPARPAANARAPTRAAPRHERVAKNRFMYPLLPLGAVP